MPGKVAEAVRGDEPGNKPKGPSRRRGPSEIVIYRDWCKACGICIEFCPTKVYETGDRGEPVIAHPEKCISCDLCELLCPDYAITLHRPEEEKPNELPGD